MKTIFSKIKPFSKTSEQGIPAWEGSLNSLDKDIINLTGYSAVELKKYCCIPQATKNNKYCLVTSNPELIDQEAFKKEKIEIFQADYQAIETHWESYFDSVSNELDLKNIHLKETLEQLCSWAKSENAKEITVNSTTSNKYSFSNEFAVFEGDIDETFFKTLLETDTKLIGLGAGSITIEKHSNHTEAKINLKTDNKKQILLVDDDTRFSFLLKRILEGKGWEVHCSTNGEKALQYLEQHSATIDLVISDVKMPGLDGIGFAESSKQQFPKTPIIILTSTEDKETEARCIELGIKAFIQKDENPSILLAWCKQFFGEQTIH